MPERRDDRERRSGDCEAMSQEDKQAEGLIAAGGAGGLYLAQQGLKRFAGAKPNVRQTRG
jgi:hypothetical protein